MYDIDFKPKNFGSKNCKRELEEGYILRTLLDFVSARYEVFRPEFEIDTSHCIAENKASYHIRVKNMYVDDF